MLVQAISGGKMRDGLKEGIRIPLQEKRFFDLWFQRRTVHRRGREVWQQVCVVGLAVSKCTPTREVESETANKPQNPSPVKYF